MLVACSQTYVACIYGKSRTSEPDARPGHPARFHPLKLVLVIFSVCTDSIFSNIGCIIRCRAWVTSRKNENPGIE